MINSVIRVNRLLKVLRMIRLDLGLSGLLVNVCINTARLMTRWEPKHFEKFSGRGDFFSFQKLYCKHTVPQVYDCT